jgi:alpha-D-ribose 1-methylphosphonate 5-triphosphate synthase subunit PhnI
MRAEELGEEVTAPAQNVEFVLYHSDNIEATGFVEHLKLPHYVDFQSELENLRRMRREHEMASPPLAGNGQGEGAVQTLINR